MRRQREERMPIAKYKPQLLLGSDSHVMQWNPALGIFRYTDPV